MELVCAFTNVSFKYFGTKSYEVNYFGMEREQGINTPIVNTSR
jgi:hypothetical protein